MDKVISPEDIAGMCWLNRFKAKVGYRRSLQQTSFPRLREVMR